jgi:hypothetical protein
MGVEHLSGGARQHAVGFDEHTRLRKYHAVRPPRHPVHLRPASPRAPPTDHAHPRQRAASSAPRPTGT